MKISAEEKEKIIKKLDERVGKMPFFYMKFCKNRERAESICDGKLYANTAEFFRKLAAETGEKGQADEKELFLCLDSVEVSFIDNVTGKLVAFVPNGKMKYEFKNDKNIPMVSFVGIPLQEMNFLEIDEENDIVFSFPFTDQDYETIKEKFGEFVVVVSGEELSYRLNNFSQETGCEYAFSKIDYREENSKERVEAFVNGDRKRLFYKNMDFLYQREYRLMFGMEMPEDHIFSIGKLATAKVEEAKNLKNLKLCMKIPE